MPLIYSLVASGTKILAECSMQTGNFSVVASRILERIPPQNGKQSYAYDRVRLTVETMPLAKSIECLCCFVNDELSRPVLTYLAANGLRAVALRCAGFNNVDMVAADELNVKVLRVPRYSPESVAEHAVALMLTLNRKTHKAYARVREGDFRLNGLLGFNMSSKVAGVVGTGAIGSCVCRILRRGFNMRVLAFDTYRSAECEAMGVEYVDSLDDMWTKVDIITLHCPLNPETVGLINDSVVRQTKKDVMIINTARGALVDSSAVIRGLKDRIIGYLGLDVYEEEQDLFFEDLSSQIIDDDVFVRLQTFPNVLITGHQAYFTVESLREIALTSIQNLKHVASKATSSSINQVITTKLLIPQIEEITDKKK